MIILQSSFYYILYIFILIIKLHNESDEVDPTTTCTNHNYTIRRSRIHHHDIIGIHKQYYHG